MQRDDMLAKVEAAYQARRTGDFAKLEEIVAPGATFHTAGDESLVAHLPGARGAGVEGAARALFDTIAEPFETTPLALGEFDDRGRISSGRQFGDTAKFVEVMRG